MPRTTCSRTRRSAPALALGIALLSTTALAQVQDTVTVRYLSGYPLPGRSMERADVRIERARGSTKVGADDVDRFFASVEAILVEYRIVKDWQLVIPDAPSVEITVDVNGRRVRLASAHVPLEREGKVVVTERGAEPLDQRTRDAVLAQQGEDFRRQRQAFDRLLDLTLQRARARFAP
jgi:hypothetical protein